MPKRIVYETLTPEDVAGRYVTVVKISPVLPQERMVLAQLAQAYRTPGADGRPLFDDHTIREEIVETPFPDTVERRVDAQMLPAQSKEIADLLKAAREQKWMDDNPETVALAEKRIGKALDMRPEDVMQLLKLLMKAQGGAAGLEQMLALSEGQAAGALPPGMPPGGMGAPPGANPAALPSQMMMTPEQGLPNPDELAASQERRGRPQQPF